MTLRGVSGRRERVRRLETRQSIIGEGPCLDCHRTGEEILIPEDLRGARERWPRFAPAALGAGFRSVRAVPLRLDGRTVGGLNLFDGRVSAGPGADVPELVQALADLAVIALLHRRHGRRLTAAEEITAALADRTTIEQAKGSSPRRAESTWTWPSRCSAAMPGAAGRAWRTPPGPWWRAGWHRPSCSPADRPR
ncbi:hypothetical protein GCM10009639_24670 [Kitasatospora putterlickiae]|uniref:GAF domain-containing protein n=1 Tax=Kitasatospora putterlickiae TaxID=221725 RepID=A0ABP4IKI4_9ACTN